MVPVPRCQCRMAAHCSEHECEPEEGRGTNVVVVELTAVRSSSIESTSLAVAEKPPVAA